MGIGLEPCYPEPVEAWARRSKKHDSLDCATYQQSCQTFYSRVSAAWFILANAAGCSCVAAFERWAFPRNLHVSALFSCDSPSSCIARNGRLKSIPWKVGAGSTNCTQLNLNLNAPGGLAITSNGNLIAVDRSARAAYTYKAPKFTKLIDTTNLKGTYSPGGIALSKNGKHVWVVDQGRNVVDEIAYPAGGAASVILNGLYEPVGVAAVI
jgi:hypothetical protein